MEREYICHTYCQDYLESKEFTRAYLFGLILARSLRLGYSAMHNLHKLLQKLSKLSDLSRTTFQDSQISQPIVHFRPFPGSIRVGGQKTGSLPLLQPLVEACPPSSCLVPCIWTQLWGMGFLHNFMLFFMNLKNHLLHNWDYLHNFGFFTTVSVRSISVYGR